MFPSTKHRLHGILASSLFIATGVSGQQWQWVVDRPLPGEFQGKMAYDEARERVALFGSVDGIIGQMPTRSFTYEWDGERWMHRCTEEFQVRDTALCYDSVRQRVVRTFGTYDGIASAQTWEWDGATWTLLTASGPAPRYMHAATFHKATGKVLAFGGGSLWHLVYHGDTLQLTGSLWTQSTPAVSPTPRFGAGMAYDAIRQRSVLFGGAIAAMPGLLGETWEWNGLAWQQRSPVNVPSARVTPALAYDPKRGRIVLFGGADSLGARNDTWEWDGTNWQQVTTAHAPSPRANAAMVFDRAAGHLILFGGNSGSGYVTRHSDTWCYDGTDWRQLRGDAGPTRRSRPALVHDPFRGRTVLFGGGLGDNLTWETDGRTWHGVLANPRPTIRYNHHAAFDSARRRMVLFGGQDGSSVLLGDTWEWDGTIWTQYVTTPAPVPRWGGCMAFDAGRNVTVLYGGQGFGGVHSETWEWNGLIWQQRSTVHVPLWENFVMTYDPGIGRIVMFGGSDQQGVRSDTWHYDGVDWTLVGVTGPTSPPPRAYPALTYHAGRGRTVMFGGGYWGSFRNDLWQWDGSSWTEWLVAERPDPQSGGTLAYDSTNDRLVLTGGQFGQLADTWVLSPTGAATVTTYGSGCPAPTPPRLRSDAPFLGNEGFSVELGNTAPLAPALLLCGLGSTSVPLPGGCTLLVQAPVITAAGAANAFGVARFRFPVPMTPLLRGNTVFVQAAVLWPGSSTGTAWTNGLRLTVGD